MGVCSGLGRVVLIILNIVFVLIGLGLLAVGGILKYTPGTLMTFLSAGLDTLIPPGVDGIAIPKTVSFLPMFGDIGLALLIGGAVLFILSFLACCGACCRWRPFLIIFVIVMIVLIVVTGAIGGLFLVKDSILHQNIKDRLSNTVVEEYENDQKGLFSQIMNILHIKLSCCGFAGPESYTVEWKTHSDVVPMSCAKTLDVSSHSKWKNSKVTDGFFWTSGCYDKLTDLIENNKTWAIIALVALELLFLLEVIFAIVIVIDVGKDNKIGPI